MRGQSFPGKRKILDAPTVKDRPVGDVRSGPGTEGDCQRRRDEARKLLARDIDPSAYRKAQKQSRRQWARNSFEAVAREWLAKHSPNWSTDHARRLESELEQNVFPSIGAKPVAEVTAPELLAVVRRVEVRAR